MWRLTSLLLVAAVTAPLALAQVTTPPEPMPQATSPATDPATPPPRMQAIPPPDEPTPPKKPKPKAKLPPAEPAADEIDDTSLATGDTGSNKPPSFRCFVRDVMAFYDRTHVRCYNKARGKIAFFAVDTAQPIAATVMSKALSAIQLGKPLTVTYAPGADLNPTNCNAANCRRLIDIKN